MKVSVVIEVLKVLKRANGQRVSMTSLGGSAGCSERTVGRCLEELICCGCPIDIKKGPHGGVKIAGDFL